MRWGSKARPVGEAATHSMLRQSQWASERYGWGVCSGAFQAGADENKCGDGRVPPREAAVSACVGELCGGRVGGRDVDGELLRRK